MATASQPVLGRSASVRRTVGDQTAAAESWAAFSGSKKAASGGARAPPAVVGPPKTSMEGDKGLTYSLSASTLGSAPFVGRTGDSDCAAIDDSPPPNCDWEERNRRGLFSPSTGTRELGYRCWSPRKDTSPTHGRWPVRPLPAESLTASKQVSVSEYESDERRAFLSHCLSLMETLQLEGGAFSSSEFHLVRGSVVRRPEVFATALIAWLVTDIFVVPKAAQVADRAVEWLASQVDDSGLWAFRGRAGEFPPDLDDTAVALLAIGNRRKLLRSEVTRLNQAFKRDPKSGLLGTWAAGTTGHQTFDLTANLHAMLALKKADLCSPSLEAAFSQRSRGPNSDESPYYCSALPFLAASLQNTLSRECDTDSLSSLNSSLSAATDALKRLAVESSFIRSIRTNRTTREIALYRRRSQPVFYTCDAVLLAYRYWLTSLQIWTSSHGQSTQMDQSQAAATQV